jgi:hypothetical protein
MPILGQTTETTYQDTTKAGSTGYAYPGSNHAIDLNCQDRRHHRFKLRGPWGEPLDYYEVVRVRNTPRPRAPATRGFHPYRPFGRPEETYNIA